MTHMKMVLFGSAGSLRRMKVEIAQWHLAALLFTERKLALDTG
jgi:hypothetical protein